MGLSRAGFKQPVKHCHDGLRALDYFSMVDPQSAPHVVLLDFHMPGMNGLEVLHWLRENSDPSMAIYLLTSSDDPAHKRQAIAYGTTEFLLKSPYADELIEKLDGLIELINGHEASVASEQGNAKPAPVPQELADFSEEQP
jgi:two-component system response regulator FixJ